MQGEYEVVEEGGQSGEFGGEGWDEVDVALVGRQGEVDCEVRRLQGGEGDGGGGVLERGGCHFLGGERGRWRKDLIDREG